MKSIRKKGKWRTGETKFVIEENGKYIETLPKVEELLEILRLEDTSKPPKEQFKKIEEIKPKDSFIPELNDPHIRDGKGILLPSAKEESNKDSVIWECDRCNFKTGLIFEDRRCPNCSQRKIQDELNKLGVI